MSTTVMIASKFSLPWVWCVNECFTSTNSKGFIYLPLREFLRCYYGSKGNRTRFIHCLVAKHLKTVKLVVVRAKRVWIRRKHRSWREEALGKCSLFPIVYFCNPCFFLYIILSHTYPLFQDNQAYIDNSLYLSGNEKQWNGSLSVQQERFESYRHTIFYIFIHSLFICPFQSYLVLTT